jgi:NAD(P)H dehydrogenase (quinone)
MIMITGATGQLGAAVIRYLLEKTDASKLAVLVRDPSKAQDLSETGIQVRQGDYDDTKSLVQAFSGVEKLYFVSGSDIMKRGLQHKNVVDAAMEAGVKHVFYTSFQRHNESESSPIALVAKAHIDTENQLKDSGLAYTILRHNLYADIVPMFVGENVLQSGLIYLPAGEGKAAYVSRDNMAEAAASLLLSDGHQNKIYNVSNNQSVSYAEIAELMSKITGKEIRYLSPSVEEFNAELGKAGVPEDIIGLMSSFSQAISQKEFDLPDDTLEKLLGRKPDTMSDYLSAVYAS